jgi:hypothetical protein
MKHTEAGRREMANVRNEKAQNSRDGKVSLLMKGVIYPCEIGDHEII